MSATTTRPHENNLLSPLKTPDVITTFYLTSDPSDPKFLKQQAEKKQQHEILIKSSSKITKPDPFRWTTFQSYAPMGISGSERLVSPRYQHEKINNYTSLPIHDSLQKWLENNVASYLSHQSAWPERLFPSRLGYVYGMEGNGKATCIANFCKTHGVNLLFVKSFFIDTLAFLEYTSLAKERQPCIIYFDNATSFVADVKTSSSFVATIKGDLDPKAHNVWVMVSSDLPPLQVAPPFADLIAENGSVLYVPLFEKYDTKLLFVNMCVNMLQATPDPLDSVEWQHALEDIADSADGCTMREIYQFIHRVFSSIRASVGGPPIAPSPMDFANAVKQLPCRIETHKQNQASLVMRNVGEERRTMETGWACYLRKSNIASIRYKSPTPYNPESTSGSYAPSTPTYTYIQSTSDDYEEDFYYKNDNKRQRS